jgi:NAD(P)-dependent dehydrogenase (short-subunit alcohol dehydrogenase family)
MAINPTHAGNKNALIVGASRGLGLGLARELASRGWHVVATSRGEAKELDALAQGSASRITVEHVDITDRAASEGLARRLGDRRFDFILLNAGVYGPQNQSVASATPEEIGTLVFTNAFAPVRLARLLLPLVVNGGTIAFMSSRMGSVADNQSGGGDWYRASKAALNTLTRSFAANEASGRPVTVLTLHPGWVRTAMGGSSAPLSVEESVRGLADVIEAQRAAGHYFLDYRGHTIPW